MMAVDPRRYGPYTSKRYVVQKNEETYRNVFVIHFRMKSGPMRDRPRPVRCMTSSRAWARFSASATAGSAPTGLPRRGVEPKDRWSFRRSNYFSHVGSRSAAHTPHVGMIDLTPFTKHEVTGPGPEAWLDSLVANKVPTKIGRIALCHALTRRGGIRSEFTITKIADEQYYVVSAGAAERYDSDYLQKMLPAPGGGASVSVAQHHHEPRLLRARRSAFARGTGEAHRHAARQCRVSLAHRTGAPRWASRPMSICCA